MRTLWQDIRYGLRILCKRPAFTAVALVTLAIGIGANTIMFSISDLLLLLEPRKVKNPKEMVFCSTTDGDFSSFRYSGYQTLRDSGLAFRDLMAQSNFMGSGATVIHGGWALQMRATYVSANYFSFLGVTPALGRGFLPEEEPLGSAPVTVLGHRLWKRLGGDPGIIGRFLNINAVRCQVVGVAPKNFTGASLIGPDLWLPMGSYRAVSTFYRGRNRPADASADYDYPWCCDILGRLKPGLTKQAAQAQLQSLVPQFQTTYPKSWDDTTAFFLRRPGRIKIDQDNDYANMISTTFSMVLMGVSAIILLIACLNLANMLMVQGTSRRREIAVRMAIGGGRLRIIRQLFIESGILAILGGILGILLALGGMRTVNVCIANMPEAAMRGLRVGLNLRILAVTLGACLIATVLFGLRPALWLSKRDIAGEMKASAGTVLGSLRRKRRGLSVAGQIALAVTLVLSATLLTHSALNVAKSDPRFNLTDKLIVQIDPLSAGDDKTQSLQDYEAIANHLASLPEVEALGTTPRLFYGGGGPIIVAEYQPKGNDNKSRRSRIRDNAFVSVGRDYFKAMEIPLLQGRRFNRMDHTPEAEKVAIIDETLAKKLRPDGDAVGCLIKWGIPEAAEVVDDPIRVVGIVANMSGVRDRKTHGQMYMPVGPDSLCSHLCLHVPDKRSMEVLRKRIAQEIHQVAPQVPVLSVKTLAQIRDEDSAVWMARFAAHLAMAAGAVSLFLAALGIYTIKGYMVASRTSEIGVRQALGATHQNIIGMVLREGLVLTILALMVGLGLGLAIAKVSANILYGISPIDPISIAVTTSLLGATALLASYLPARRAARIDPMVALRYE